MRTHLLLLLRYLAAVIALVALVSFIDARAVSHALGSAQLELLIIGLGLGFLGWLLNTVKWKLLLRARDIHVGLVRLYRLNLASALYGTVLPGQVAGEAAKLLRLSRSPRRRAVLMASVLVDRLTGLMGLLLLGLAASAVSQQDPAPVLAVFCFAVLLTVFGAGVVLRMGRRADGAETRSRVRRFAHRALSALADYRDAGVRALVETTVLAVAFQAFVTFNVWVFAESLGLDVSPIDLAWVMAIVSVVQLLPITVAAIGTREAAFILLLGTLGVERADALALSLLVLAGNAVIAIAGAISEVLPEGVVHDPDTVDVSA